MTKRLSIEGMSCNHCVGRIKAALSGVRGVASVQVDVQARRATVDGTDLDDAALKAAVTEAGYEVIAVEG